MPSSASRAGECRKRPALHRRKTPRSRHAKEGGTSLKDGEVYLCLRHARESAGSGQRYIGGKALVRVTRGKALHPEKRRRSLPLPAPRGRMPEAASGTSAGKALARVTRRRRYILKKTEKSTFACVACGKMPEAASDTSAEKPSFASREGRWDILKRRRSLPFLPRAREDAGGGQRYIGGKALVRVTRRRALHP